MRALLLLWIAVAISFVAAPAALAADAADGRPTFDARDGDRAAVSAKTKDAREDLQLRLGPQATVSTDPVNGGVRSILRTDALLSGPATGTPKAIALNWARAHLGELGLTEADIDALKLTHSDRIKQGVSHLTFSQTAAGITSYDTNLSFTVTKDGRVASVGGSAVHALRPNRTKPVIGAADALERAQVRAGGPRSSVALQQTAPKLVVFASPDGDRLGWRLTVAGEAPFLYDIVIDATDGSLLSRISLTDFAVNADVFENHPGPAASGTRNPQDISAYLTNPAAPGSLTGPNAHAFADLVDNDVADAGEEIAPNAGPNFTFPQTLMSAGTGQSCPTAFGGATTCTWTGVPGASNPSGATNRKARTTQLFYFVNRYHDWLRDKVGFDSTHLNFQGVDPVIAQSDDGNAADVDHTNNANMSTPPDGQSPVMQMYFFNKASPSDTCCAAVSSADDASVVLHEYTHGLSNRLIGNGTGLVARQSGAMGEGWSDWYAMDYLVSKGYETESPATAGEIAEGEYVTNNPAKGIRSEAMDCPVTPTVAACNPTAPSSAGNGGYTLGDMGHVGKLGGASGPDAFEVHDDGEIWAQTLWELRAEIADPDITRTLVTEGMRALSGNSNPSFLDERNAILVADKVLGTGKHDEIWNAFARRGFGYGARTTSAESTRSHEDFSLPRAAEVTKTTLDIAKPKPGETVEVAIELTNPAASDIDNVSGDLVSDSPDVTVTDATKSFGLINGLGTVSRTFTVKIGPGPLSGDIADLHLHVTADATPPLDLPVAIPFDVTPHGIFDSTDVPKSIPDSSATGVTSTINVTNTHPIDDLSVCVSIVHTAVVDLHAELTAPSTGKHISLFEEPGHGDQVERNPNFTNVLFDDRGTRPIQDIPFSSTANPAATGLYAPNEELSKFAGQNPAGTWTLKVWDVGTDDLGSLTRWSLLFDEASCLGTIVSPSTQQVVTPTPKPSFSNASKTARLDKKGRFKFHFTGSPAGARGIVTVKTAKKIKSGKSKKILGLGSHSFQVPAAGGVDLQLKVSKSTLKKLKRKKSIPAKVTLDFIGVSYTTSLTLKR